MLEQLCTKGGTLSKAAGLSIQDYGRKKIVNAAHISLSKAEISDANPFCCMLSIVVTCIAILFAS